MKKFALLLVFALAIVMSPVSAENKYITFEPTVLPEVGYVNFAVSGVPEDPYLYIGNETEIANVTEPNFNLTKIQIYPDGTTESLTLPAGNYTAYMWHYPWSIEPEEKKPFVVGMGAFDRVPFVGVIRGWGSGGCGG